MATPEEYKEPAYLEAMRGGDIEKVKSFLATLPDDAARREALLNGLDSEEQRVKDIHDDREGPGDDISPESVNAAFEEIEKDRNDPNTFIGKLEILLKSY